MRSSRLYGKTMAELAGGPSLAHIIGRLKDVPSLDGIIVATTDDPVDAAIADCATQAGVPAYRGSADDVLDRTLRAARSVGAATIVTVNGDSPLVDPGVVERLLQEYRARRPDYASNRLHGHVFPLGMDVEAYPAELLAAIEPEAREPRDREHVTVFFYERPERFDLLSVEPEPHQHRPEIRLTLDTEADLELIRALYDALYVPGRTFGLDEILEHIDRNPDLADLNRQIVQRRP
jgi:spore coat polysaccharide biosynthesis protein SpsF